MHRSRSRYRFGGVTQYTALRDAAIAAARRNSAALWFAGAPSDLAGFVYQDSSATTPATGTDPIGYLRDRANNLYPATQATAANKPTLELQANGYYGIRFDGTNDFLSTLVAVGGSGDFTLFLTGKPTTSGSLLVPIGVYGGAANNFGYVCRSTSNFAAGGAGSASQSGTFISSTTWANNVASVVVTKNGTTAKLYVSGVVARTETVASAGVAINTQIGCGYDNGTLSNGFFWPGLIQLAAAVPFAMPEADILAIDAFGRLLGAGA